MKLERDLKYHDTLSWNGAVVSFSIEDSTVVTLSAGLSSSGHMRRCYVLVRPDGNIGAVAADEGDGHWGWVDVWGVPNEDGGPTYGNAEFDTTPSQIKHLLKKYNINGRIQV